MTTKFTNSDGLVQEYGTRDVEDKLPRVSAESSVKKQMVVKFGASDLPGFDQDASGGSTPDSYGEKQEYIPAGSYITNAYVIVTSAFTIGSADTVNIGLYQKDGTVIDLDGIDAAVAAAALASGSAITCDGALVGGTATVGAADAYLKVGATASDANITAGSAVLVVEFIAPR